jgi:hypothetical protein
MRDEGDIILVDLKSNKTLMLVIVERGMTLDELQRFYRTNSEKQIYTLMLFWVDMLLPRDGSKITLDNWLSVEVRLHNEKLYGYEVAGKDAYFFPVQMQGKGMKRVVRYGNVVNYAALGGKVVGTLNPYMPGEWYVANFDSTAHIPREQASQPIITKDQQLKISYTRLGLPPDANFDSVKRAYRTLARLYHPDLNTNAGADERMKQINEAYQHIEKFIGGKS